MFAIEIRDRIMIAHSLPDPSFGPAQNLHGATFLVDAAFFRERLNRQNVVLDIGAAQRLLRQILSPLDYMNLDEATAFRGALTTVEFLCKYIFDALADATSNGNLGEDGKELAKIRVTLHESDVARAFYEARLPKNPLPE